MIELVLVSKLSSLHIMETTECCFTTAEFQCRGHQYVLIWTNMLSGKHLGLSNLQVLILISFTATHYEFTKKVVLKCFICLDLLKGHLQLNAVLVHSAGVRNNIQAHFPSYIDCT